MAITSHPELPFGLSLDTVAQNLCEIVQIGMTPEQKKQRLEERLQRSDLFTDIWEHELHRAINNCLWCLQENKLISDLKSGYLRTGWFIVDGIKPDFSFLARDKRIVMEVKVGTATQPSKLKVSVEHHLSLLEGQFWIICTRNFGDLGPFWQSLEIVPQLRYFSDPGILSGASCIAYQGFEK